MLVRIFISYAREDKIFAEKLFDELHGHPFLSPWLDSKNLLAGSNWKEEILAEIEGSDYILILLSKKSIGKNGFFQKEMREAIERLSYLAPGNRVVIPVRVESCEPKHRELRLLNYLDLYPSWEDGVSRLYESIGVRRFTHTYRVTGYSRFDTAYLTKLEDDKAVDSDQEFVYVSLLTIPSIDANKVPTEPLPRKGAPLNMLVELWSIAGTYKHPFYVKEDWSILDRLLFQERSETDKKELVDVFIRQWAYAKEQKTTYNSYTWNALSRLVQNYDSLPYQMR